MSYARYLSKLAALLNSDGTVQPSSLSTGHPTWDSSGNVGIGVSPSAWGSGLKAIQLGGTNGYVSFNNTNGGYTYWNMYNDGSNNKTLATGNIAAYGLNTSGAHVWFNGTGTAGATSSLTQAMTLDASGYLQVGTTSAIQSGSVTFAGSSASVNQLVLADTVAYNASPTIQQNFAGKYNSGGSYASFAFLRGIKENSTDGDTKGALLLATNNGSSVAERARIDSSGNLGIGTTSPGKKLDVTGDIRTSSSLIITSNGTGSITDGANTYVGLSSSQLTLRTDTALPIVALTNGTERMRIDSSGNLLVGTTSGTENRIYKSSSTYSTRIENTSTSTGSTLLLQSGRSAGTGFTNIECYANGALNFQVLGNGNVQNTNNSYGAISDVKLKENIVDASPKLAQLNQVRVVNYNLIGDENKQLGVIAQELEQVFPSLVEEAPDRDVEGNDLGTTTKSVKYSVFVPMLIKAIQEQQAIIEGLTSRITALESA